MCLPPVTKSAQVTWYKQAKGVQPEKVHLLHAPNLEEKCVVIALRPVIVNHGLDSLQCELSRQVAVA